MWKVHQHAFYLRIDQIEAHFRGEESTPPFQISAAWRQSFRVGGSHLRALWNMVPVFWQTGVYLPHILIVADGIGLYWLHRPA